MVSAEQRLLRQDEQDHRQRHPAVRVPMVILGVISFTTGMVVLTALVVFTPRLAVLQPNPLAAYTDLIPGRITNVALLDDFSCSAAVDSMKLCSFTPTAGTVEHISIIIKHDVIYGTSFHFRDNSLRIGDLALMWGTPRIVRSEESISLFWFRNNTIITLPSLRGRLNYSRPIRAISMGENQMIWVRTF